MNKKISVLLITILVSTNLFSNSTEVTKKDLKIIDKIYYLKSTNEIFSGKVTEGRDRFYYLDGKPEGKWLEFYKNGNLKSIINWKNGKLTGKYIVYDKNGKKSTEAIYKDSKENGKYFLYYSNGNIRTKGEYENGKPIGVWEYFDKDGKLTGKAETK